MSDPGMPCTFRALLTEGATRLGGGRSAALDARVLLMAASGFDRADLIARDRDPASVEITDRFHGLVARRAAGEPVAYVVGRQEFYGRVFRVGKGVLIPRPETEMLVDAGVRWAAAGARVLDLGTGSGAILLSLLAEREDLRGEGIDLSSEAVEFAEANRAALGLEGRCTLTRGDFREAGAGPFGLIVSNPPYIGTGEPLPDSVARYEPKLALRAGEDGLSAYRVISELVAERLADDGTALLEIGATQGEAVRSLFAAALPEREISVHRDLAGLDRMVAIRPVAP